MKKVNKKYIYVPAYILFVVLCVVGLYSLLSRPPEREKQEKIPVITPLIQKSAPAQGNKK